MKAAADFTRPSSLHAVSLCAGRPMMEAAVVNAFGEPEESTEASMGTRAHAYVAQAITTWKECCQLPGDDEVIELADFIAETCNEATKAGLDHWTVWCIQSCLEFARDLIHRHAIEPSNVLVEHPLELADLGMPRQGTADLILVIPFKKIFVIDWKFTFLDQGDATDHDQLQVYATAAAADFRTQSVDVWLFAPRDEKTKRATGATFDANALAANAIWTRAIVARTKAPNPALTPGYEQCLYCRALTRCAAAQEWIMNASEALTVIGTPVDADAWGDLAAAGKIAEKFGDDAKEQTKAHMMAGGSATGWGLGSGRCIRSCSNPALAIQRLESAGMGALALEAVSLSPAKLPSEALAVISDLVHEKPSAPSLKAVKARAVAA